MSDFKPNFDERGSFTEVYRSDWDWPIQQANISISKAGVIRAWHRHAHGQLDYMVLLRGAVKFAYWDGHRVYDKVFEVPEGQPPRDLFLVDGAYWHGFKALTDCTILYFTTRLYNYESPDEERKPPDDKEIGYTW